MSEGLEEIRELLVGPGDAGQRLDRFLAEKFPEFSRSRLQNLIRSENITLSGEACRPSETLTAGQQIRLAIPPPEPMPGLIPVDIPVSVLHEDSDLLVLNKPAGMTVHPGAGTGEDTLVHALLHHCRDLSGIGGVERPGIVHRLDKETSGCLVIAKKDRIHQALAEQFANRRVEKTYLAIVKGIPRRQTGSIDAPIGRHRVHRQKMSVLEEGKGRPARTEFRVLASGEGMSLLECRPLTGRTHQIRVHLRHLGHPILGDPVYGTRGCCERHLLHAWKLSFVHPGTETMMQFTAPVPEDFPLLPPGGS